MNRSGSKEASPPSRGMTWAILLGRSSTSNVSTRRAALLPASSCFHVCSAPTPNGESSPMPVTTTRLIACTPVSRSAEKSGRRLVDVLDGVADRQDRLGRVVGDLDAELFLERHDQLDGVEAVRAKIVDEARALGDLVGIDAEMLDNDFLDAFCGVAHLQTLDLVLAGNPAFALVGLR